MCAAARAEDVVARLGGDEFVIALVDIARRGHAERVAQKVIQALEPPFRIEGHTLRVGAAIGISIFPRDGDTPETLLRMADIAMYRSKETGQTGYTFFSREMNRQALERLRLESGLRQGIAQNELCLFYQPKIDVTSGRIAGAEALVRWQDRPLVRQGHSYGRERLRDRQGDRQPDAIPWLARRCRRRRNGCATRIPQPARLPGNTRLSFFATGTARDLRSDVADRHHAAAAVSSKPASIGCRPVSADFQAFTESCRPGGCVSVRCRAMRGSCRN